MTALFTIFIALGWLFWAYVFLGERGRNKDID